MSLRPARSGGGSGGAHVRSGGDRNPHLNPSEPASRRDGEQEANWPTNQLGASCAARILSFRLAAPSLREAARAVRPP